MDPRMAGQEFRALAYGLPGHKVAQIMTACSKGYANHNGTSKTQMAEWLNSNPHKVDHERLRRLLKKCREAREPNQLPIDK